MTTKQLKNEADEIDLSPNPWIRTTSRVTVWVGNGHWWSIALVILALIAFEIYDFTQIRNGSIQIIEWFFLLSLLLAVGLLIVFLSQGVKNQVRIIRILDAKHQLDLDFSEYQDWEALVAHIAALPGSLAFASQACLFVSNDITNQFELTAQWSKLGGAATVLCSDASCQECVGDGTSTDLAFRQCSSGSKNGESLSPARQYCLPIKDNERLQGVLKFSLEPGTTLSNEQTDIFRNIGIDIAFALKAGRDRKVLADLSESETALAERRSVSRYLHDHLGQSLGYLHLKMDQLLTQKDQLSLEKVLDDLEFMRDATYESYEIVRGILETIHPETTQTLTNLLMEHARKVSKRANIDVTFKTKGRPVLLPDKAQKAIFYAFEELLSNVEKHAQATRVSILAEWGADHFTLTISDNGVGFVPQSVNTDQHFGLEFLSERMASVNGQITLHTVENSGTEVNILVPSASQNQLGGGA